MLCMHAEILLHTNISARFLDMKSTLICGISATQEIQKGICLQKPKK